MAKAHFFIFSYLINISLFLLSFNLIGADSVSFYQNIIDQKENTDKKAFKWLMNYYVVLDIDSSEYFARLAVDRYKNQDDSELAFAYTSLGQILYLRKDVEEAQRYSLKGIELAKEIEDYYRVGDGYQVLANVQADMRNQKDALYYYTKAKEFYELSDGSSPGKFYVDIATFHWNIDSLNKALNYYREGIHAYKKKEEIPGQINCLKSIGGIYYELGKIDSFLIYLNQSIRIANSYYRGKPNTLELTAYQNLAVYNFNNEDYDSAIFYLNKFVEGNALIGNKNKLQDGYDFLAEIDYIREDYKSAYDNLLLSKTIYDSLTALSNEKEIVRVQRKYNYEIQEKRRINAELEAVKANEQRIIYLFLSVATVLIVITLGLLYRSRIIHDKKELVIKEQRINEMLKEQEIKSLNEMMQWQGEERNRVAKDLHDRLGVILSTIKLHVSNVQENIEGISEEEIQQFKYTTGLLDDAVDEVRRIARDLISGVLSEFGLVKALENLAESISMSNALKCEVFATHMEERLDSTLEIGIYRIVQECLSNALKHSKAKTIEIQLIRHDDLLSVTIDDHGKGFNLDEVLAKGKGMGLGNIKSRVEKLGGTCHFETSPGRGTSIIADIPIKKTDE